MILTQYVMYKGRKKRVDELSPTCNFKVDVQCPECGEIRTVHYKSVHKAGHTLCRACAIKKKLSKNLPAGAKFGRLTVLRPAERRGHSVCECECGNVTEIADWSLENGKTQSCGCLRSENIQQVAYHPDGAEHWNWKGGITNERQSVMTKKSYREWREAVFQRDNFDCQKCGQHGGELRAHHIFNFADHPALRLDLGNGITLCEKCHRRFHRINGFRTNREQLVQFLGGG